MLKFYVKTGVAKLSFEILRKTAFKVGPKILKYANG